MRPLQAGTDATLSTSTAPDEELEHLIGRAGEALNLQCRAAHQELEQTQLILADATRKLLDSFHAVHRELAALAAVGGADKVERKLLAASQHMQFSDLMGQLLATTEQRVDGVLLVSQRLQELMRAFGTASAPSQPHDTPLAGEKRAFLEALAALESCGNTRVRQSDMQAGEIDLF
jgi:hypothetical protein